MITSMTSFVRKSTETEWGILIWEIRTINHRYLEICPRLPDSLRRFEPSIREIIQKYLKRGKVDATFHFQSGKSHPCEIAINENFMEQLAKVSKTVLSFFPNGALNVMDVLSYPGILQVKENDLDDLGKIVITLLEKALVDCVKTRAREGDGIKVFIKERLDLMSKQIAIVQERVPVFMELAKEKIMARFQELSLEIDNARLEQEMLWLAQKTDIVEEIQRLKAHITEVKRVLNEGAVVGRRLDFLMQELNRETNTLGAKSLDANIAKAVIELKVYIEQMREQVQNIE